jgi:hypothetical protein
MLQHNASNAGRHAHVTHAVLVGLHTLCCGTPLLMMTFVSIVGASATLAFAFEKLYPFHDLIHQNEIWILGASAVLVGLGAILEVRARSGGRVLGFPYLFAISVGCFVLNAGVVLLHRAV